MPYSTPSTATLLCAGALGIFFLYRLSERVLTAIGIAPHRVKLPGPRGVPFFGNLIQLKDGHARPLGRWAKQYGPIVRVAFGDREAVIINSYNAVSQTLVQQGQAFQSRPKFKLWHGAFIKAAGEDAPSTLGTSPMDDRINMFRRHLTAQTAHVRARRYNHFISRRFYRFVNLLADTAKTGKAEDLGFHMWTTAVGLSTDMLFGVQTDEAYTRHISETELLIFRQRTIGKPLHDYVPAVALLEKVVSVKAFRPIWKAFGVNKWVEDFNESEENAKQLRDTEAGYCRNMTQQLHERIERGDMTPSQLGDLVRVYGTQITPTDEFRAATSLVGSGMGMGTLLAWLAPKLAATPEIQEKAYAAIKEVYGGEAPDPLDTDRVDYIRALAQETGRFFVTARLGFSRETSEEADIDGVKIPAGTLVMNNAFWINRDSDRYDSPDEFIPERWMDGHYGRLDGKAVKMGVPHLNHGAGRRFCVGIPYVAKVLYAGIILMVYHFKLERGVMDEEAKAKTFLDLRKAREMTVEVDPIADQVSERDPQAIPLMAGIKVIPRDAAGLARWLAEAPNTLDQFDEPDLSIKAAGES